MTNDLNWKDLQKDLDDREKELVNFVLDLVEKGVEKGFNETFVSKDVALKEELLTITTNLRV